MRPSIPLPLSLPIVITAAWLVSLRDPAAMSIVATAQHQGARLVTSDGRIEDLGLAAIVASRLRFMNEFLARRFAQPTG